MGFALGAADYFTKPIDWGRLSTVLKKHRTASSAQTMAAKGTPENPLEREEVTAKALDLMGPVLGKPRSRKLIDTLFDIKRVKDVRSLRALYSA